MNVGGPAAARSQQGKGEPGDGGGRSADVNAQQGRTHAVPENQRYAEGSLSSVFMVMWPSYSWSGTHISVEPRCRLGQ